MFPSSPHSRGGRRASSGVSPVPGLSPSSSSPGRTLPKCQETQTLSRLNGTRISPEHAAFLAPSHTGTKMDPMETPASPRGGRGVPGRACGGLRLPELTAGNLACRTLCSRPDLCCRVWVAQPLSLSSVCLSLGKPSDPASSECSEPASVPTGDGSSESTARLLGLHQQEQPRLSALPPWLVAGVTRRSPSGCRPSESLPVNLPALAEERLSSLPSSEAAVCAKVS